MNYIARTTRITILPAGDPVFSSNATNVSIEDNAAGEFIQINQQADEESDQTIFIDSEMWPVLRSTIDEMMVEIQRAKQSE